MASPYYNQPQITVEEQIRLLKSEGLSFENESRARHLLSNISMFRLKSYLKPLRQDSSRQFKLGATFELAKTEHTHPLRAVQSTHLWAENQLEICLKNGAYPFNIAENAENRSKKTEYCRSPVARIVFWMAKSHRKRSIAVHFYSKWYYASVLCIINYLGPLADSQSQ